MLDATVVTRLPPAVITRLVEVVRDAPLTVTTSGAVTLTVPEVPVMVAVAEAGMADWLAVRVSVLVSVVGFGEIVPITPLGRPDTARLTLPLNPY